MIDSDYITEEMEISWEHRPEATKALDEELRAYYGMGATEYVELRNNLLREYNGRLPHDALRHKLLNIAIIDLTGRGYLSANFKLEKGFSFKLTTKAFRAIAQAKRDGDLCPNEDNAMAGIYYLRNKNLLH